MAEGETDLAERGWIVMHPKYPNGFKHFLDGQMPQQSTDDTIFLNVRLKGQPIPSPVPLVLPPGIVCWEKDDVYRDSHVFQEHIPEDIPRTLM